MLGTLRRKLKTAFSNLKLVRKIQLSHFLVILPLFILFLTLFINVNTYSRRYDRIINNAAEAGRFSINFKKDFDYKIYLLIAGHSTFEEENPYKTINEAREIGKKLVENTNLAENKNRAQSILRLLNNLEKYAKAIEQNKKTGGHYEDNIEIWENDIQTVTSLIQTSIYEYSYYETQEMVELGAEASAGLDSITYLSTILFVLLSIIAILLSFIISKSIAKPILQLNDVTSQVGQLLNPLGSMIKVSEKLFNGKKEEQFSRDDEIGRLSTSFNEMANAVYTLVNNLEEKVQERTIELEMVNNALEENKDKLQLILDSTVEAIYGIDKHGNCTFCNASCIRLLGYNQQEELLGKNMHALIHHSRKDKTPIPIEKCKVHTAFIEGNGAYADDEVFWRADGTCFDVEYYSYPQYKDGGIIGAVVTFTDNTQRKKIEEHIRYLSRHDSLTGLFNRLYFEDALKSMDIKKNYPISIIFGDVNGLKLTNDVFGHGAGDELIKKIAEVLKNVCREDDIVARMGGDEFIILLPNTDADDSQKIINRVQSELSKEKMYTIKCSMSLGYDTKTTAAQNIERIMENAENNMYKDKTANRKTVSEDMINTIVATLHGRSPQEKKHASTVSHLCYILGCAIGLGKTDVQRLKRAGFLHDIGKVVLSDYLLNKQSELTEEEQKEVRMHAAVGYRILNLFDSTLDLAYEVYYHHERWDGQGFPKGLKSGEIPLLARIISIVESYDRMVNAKGMSHKEAVREIKDNAGTQFDPEIAEVFIGLVEANKHKFRD